MKVFWSDEQLAHCNVPFVQGGIVKPSPEVPNRTQTILMALKERGHTVCQPPDYGFAPILAVHSEDYLSFLRDAHGSWTEHFGSGRHMLPNVHPSMEASCLPQSLVGRLGWYTGDIACEIMAGTWQSVYASAQAAANPATHK